MVYEWDGKEAECYRLYVEEKKSLDEVMAFWEQHGFTPRYVEWPKVNKPFAVHHPSPSQIAAYWSALRVHTGC